MLLLLSYFTLILYSILISFTVYGSYLLLTPLLSLRYFLLYFFTLILCADSLHTTHNQITTSHRYQRLQTSTAGELCLI